MIQTWSREPLAQSWPARGEGGDLSRLLYSATMVKGRSDAAEQNCISASCPVLQAELHLARPLRVRRVQRPCSVLKEGRRRVEERVGAR